MRPFFLTSQFLQFLNNFLKEPCNIDLTPCLKDNKPWLYSIVEIVKRIETYGALKLH